MVLKWVYGVTKLTIAVDHLEVGKLDLRKESLDERQMPISDLRSRIAKSGEKLAHDFEDNYREGVSPVLKFHYKDQNERNFLVTQTFLKREKEGQEVNIDSFPKFVLELLMGNTNMWIYIWETIQVRMSLRHMHVL